LKPRARIRAAAVIGSEPTIMLTGPTPACRKALAKAGMTAKDIDLFEINEAFAVVPMQTARNLGVELDRVNVNGGAIAMGHPLGATGCIILGTLLDELERRNLSTGLATSVRGRRHGHRHDHREGLNMSNAVNPDSRRRRHPRRHDGRARPPDERGGRPA
jgi:acetyl-CoA C-acetyltransferase